MSGVPDSQIYIHPGFWDELESTSTDTSTMNKRGVYARRGTDLKVDTNRVRRRENRWDRDQGEFITDITAGCERFFNDRGMEYTDEDGVKFIGPARTPINKMPEVCRRFVRKKQEEPPRSLKACVLREIVMNGRVAGLIRKTPFPTPEHEADDWDTPIKESP